MVRSQTHSHTTELKTDNITASSGSSINTAAVFQTGSEVVWLHEVRANSIIKNIKDTPNKVISRAHEVSHDTCT